MSSIEQMTLEERVRCGKAWLDEHAPTGYVFNMFIYHHERARLTSIINIDTFDYDVLALAFRHDLRFDSYYSVTSGNVKKMFGLSQENSHMMAFDIASGESREETKTLIKEWEKVFVSEFWEICGKAGNLLAKIPKNSKGRRFEDSIFI